MIYTMKRLRGDGAKFLWAAALLLQCVCASAQSYGYATTDYAWVDNASHTNVTWAGSAGCSGGWNSSPIDDDISSQIALPFTFTFGATAFNHVQVMSNGRVQFVPSATGKSYCGYGTQTVGPPPTYPYTYPNANMNNTLRPYGADLCPAGGGTGCAGRVTTTSLGTAPYRTFVVTWSQVREWNSYSSLFNVQVILYENGDFVYQFKNVANYSQGSSQVGWQVSTSDYGLVDLSSISSLAYSAVRFFKPTPPLAEYRFDECSSAAAGSVPDSSGNALNGQPFGTVTKGVAGVICAAYTFDGSSGYIQVPHNVKLDQDYVSVAAWVRHRTNSYKAWETIVAKGDTTFRLHLNGGCQINTVPPKTTSRAFTFGFNGGCANADLNSGVVPVAGQWYHVVGTYDGVTIKIFVNGVLANSAKLTTVIAKNTLPLFIGENSQQGGRYWDGSIDEVKVFGRALPDDEVYAMYFNEGAGLDRLGALRTCNICNVSIGWFNAFESSLPSTNISGVIKTKISGKAFSTSSGAIAITAINAARTAVDAAFTNKTVTVEFFDAAGETGSRDLVTGCYANSLAAVATLTNQTLVNGRLVIDPTLTNAYKRLRIKITDTSGTTGNIGCASDLFALRPAILDNSTAAAKDDTYRTTSASPLRSLTSANTGAAASAAVVAGTDKVHAAGRPFAVNNIFAKASGGATTANYDGQPTIVAGSLLLPDPDFCSTCAPGTFAVGTWTASAGALSTLDASYSEVGSFSWQLEDRTYADVDKADSTKGQRYIISNALISTGRFVPDSFLVTLNTPVLQTFGASAATCGATPRTFTYLGQPFGYATTPVVGIVAQRFPSGTTVNYQGVPGSGGLWRLPTANLAYASASSSCTAPTQTCAVSREAGLTRFKVSMALATATPGWEGGSLATETGVAAVTSNNNGTGTINFGTADKWRLYRDPSNPQVPYTAAPTVALQIDDYSESGRTSVPVDCTVAPTVTGNPTCISGALAASAVAFDSGNTFRYGRLRLSNAYGSERLKLPVATEVQYWASASSGFVRNTADNCTALATANVSLVNPQSPVTATNLTVASAGTLVNGAGTIILNGPSPSTPWASIGNVDLILNLGAPSTTTCPTATPANPLGSSTSAGLAHLATNGCSTATYTRNPTARASFGVYKSPLIYRRENY